MLEEIRESDAQVEHLWHLHLRARTVERMASYRLAFEEPAVLQAAVEPPPPAQRRHENPNATLTTEAGKAGAAGQAWAAQVARTARIQAPHNVSTQPSTSPHSSSTTPVAADDTTSSELEPQPAACAIPPELRLVSPSAANLFKFQPHVASTHYDYEQQQQQQQQQDEEEARHFDAADEYEEYHHRNTAPKRGSHI